ncbi:isopropylmalate isomerase [Aurantiacibacter flavus]|uniref:Isopropylmalate isomerase n=1 Tax=Aurantiacibacter flavus TaxID=3145232 RepID=A0ABV0CUS9_9SPHN
MTKTKIPGGKAALAGAAIGSAAIAAALLFTSRKKKSVNEAEQLPPIPSGEAPETD